MSKLVHTSTAWTGTTSQSAQSKKYTFSTEEKYIDKNIEFTVNVQSGSATTPTTSIKQSTPTLSINSTNGVVSAYSTAKSPQSITPIVNAGYVSSGTSGNITLTQSDSGELKLTTKGTSGVTTTITPTTSTQSAVGANIYTLGAINVGPIPQAYGNATGMTVTSTKLQNGVTAIGWDSTNSKAVVIQGTAAMVYNSSTEELTLPDWSVTLS